MLADSPQAFLNHGEHGWGAERWQSTFETGGWLIAEVRGQVAPVAVVRCSVLEPGSCERYVESMWVDPRYRGRGLARELLTRVKQRAIGEGANSLRLAVLDSNRPVDGVFRALGFVMVPEILHDGERDYTFVLPSVSDAASANSTPLRRATDALTVRVLVGLSLMPGSKDA
jgi:GNAT superfamily N-acetyltransferase